MVFKIFWIFSNFYWSQHKIFVQTYFHYRHWVQINRKFQVRRSFLDGPITKTLFLCLHQQKSEVKDYVRVTFNFHHLVSMHFSLTPEVFYIWVLELKIYLLSLNSYIFICKTQIWKTVKDIIFRLGMKFNTKQEISPNQ